MLKTGQEDPGNPLAVQAGGCYLWSIWTQVELCTGHERFTSPEIVTKEFNSLLGNGIRDIAKDATIEDGAAVFAQYGVKVRQILDPITGLSQVSPNYPTKKGQLVILDYHWPEKGYTHFAPATWDKKMILDPIARGANTIKNGYLHSIRVYELI